MQEISTNVESGSYIQRLKEALGTDEPAKVQRKLGISYQAAKNYLKGRLPAPEVLQGIAKETGYSIHWLLTGEGSKKVSTDDNGTSRRTEPTGRPEQLAEDVVGEGLSRAEVLLLIQLGYKILEKLERMETRLAQLDNG